MCVKECSPQFSLGRMLITPGALQALTKLDIAQALMRHVSGDWGEVGPEDWQTNNDALVYGERLLSAYRTPSDLTFWIITERDRSMTTILLPDEY